MAANELAGVGAGREWWWWNQATGIAHLRVPLTGDELAVAGEYPAVHDAGQTGVERPRTPPRVRGVGSGGGHRLVRGPGVG